MKIEDIEEGDIIKSYGGDTLVIIEVLKIDLRRKLPLKVKILRGYSFLPHMSDKSPHWVMPKLDDDRFKHKKLTKSELMAELL